MRQDTARTRAAVASLPSAIRAQVHAPVTGLDVALRTDIARARDALRAMLGDVHSIGQCGAVYAKCDNAAERWLLAVGGVSMGRVAGADSEPGYEPTFAKHRVGPQDGKRRSSARSAIIARRCAPESRDWP